MFHALLFEAFHALLFEAFHALLFEAFHAAQLEGRALDPAPRLAELREIHRHRNESPFPKPFGESGRLRREYDVAPVADQVQPEPLGVGLVGDDRVGKAFPQEVRLSGAKARGRYAMVRSSSTPSAVLRW